MTPLKLFKLLPIVPTLLGMMMMVTACGSGTGGSDGSPLREVNVDSLFSRALESLPDSLTADAIYLSCGLLRPQQAMEALRSRVSAGRISSPEFSTVAINAMWGAAAWEVYCATGSAEWLEEAYQTLIASLKDEDRYTASPIPHLSYAIPEYASSLPGYYPRTMTEMERFQTISTTVNAEQSYAWRIAAMMASELHLESEKESRRVSTDIRNAINDHLWIPDRERYAAYLYGVYFPIQNNASDAIANSLCVLFDVATPDMSRAIIANMPVNQTEVPAIYPSADTDPTLFAPTLYALAAAKVRNTRAFALGSVALHSHDIDRRNSAGVAALVTRGFFGITLLPDCIRFSPMVPAEYKGVKHIKGLKYRDSTLDISLHGTGDRIASFAIDSVVGTNPTIPANITGHHKIEITLTGNNLSARPLNISPLSTLPASPKVDWLSDRTGRITDFRDDGSYMLYINGVASEEITDGNLNLHAAGRLPQFCEITYMDEQGYRSVAPRPHIFAPQGSMITIRASSITPRRAPQHLIKDYETATNYIELAARHNTRLACYANIEIEGDYFITLGYSNGSHNCGVRSLEINDNTVGTLICPTVRADDWVTVASSNTLTVSLRSGVNKISLYYIRGTMLFNSITLIKKP